MGNLDYWGSRKRRRSHPGGRRWREAGRPGHRIDSVQVGAKILQVEEVIYAGRGDGGIRLETAAATAGEGYSGTSAVWTLLKLGVRASAEMIAAVTRKALGLSTIRTCMEPNRKPYPLL